MAILKVNGVAIQDPQTLEFQIYDLDSEEGSGRNQNGDMFRDRKAIKRKIVCNFPPLTQSQMKTILTAVEPMFFELEYPDARTGSQRTMTCYVGDRTTPIYRKDPYTQEWIWKGLSINFIER